MNDESDNQYNDMIDSLYSDFAADVLAGHDGLYGDVVEHFAQERLQSYYVQNPRVALPACWALQQARALLHDHPEASLVFAVTAAEVGLKSALLKPILHGLVHNEAFAAIVADLMPRQRNQQFRDLLFAILRNYGGVDLAAFVRPGASIALWEEMEQNQWRRNCVVHRAETVDVHHARLAVEVAGTVVEELFPTAIATLGLQMNGDLVVPP
ncbi:MAG: hypothetical protein OXH52_05995 [Gammaproteobacteria bacterium]|nr:hypothetical protein [Gammaproteobacteria bacterium]